MRKTTILAGVAVLALAASSSAFANQPFAPPSGTSSGVATAPAGDTASAIILADGRGPGGDSGTGGGDGGGSGGGGDGGGGGGGGGIG